MIRFSNEKKGGKGIHSAWLDDFNSCLVDCGLADMTLSNCSNGPKRIIAKLDRSLCNEAWIDFYLHISTHFFIATTSDHSMMLVKL